VDGQVEISWKLRQRIVCIYLKCKYKYDHTTIVLGCIHHVLGASKKGWNASPKTIHPEWI
jgi:hypothetical protein